MKKNTIEDNAECLISTSAATGIFYVLRKASGSAQQAKEQKNEKAYWTLQFQRKMNGLLPKNWNLTVISWVGHGVPPQAVNLYILALFQALSRSNGLDLSF